MEANLSLGLGVAVAASYVASIHGFKPRELRGKDRNDVAVIYHRFVNVSVVCVGLIVVEPWLMVWQGRGHGWHDNFRHLYLVPTSWEDVYNVGKCLGMMCVLYMGPIFQYLYEKPDPIRDWKRAFGNIWGFRDHVFAPVTEEIIYRAILIDILSLNYTHHNIIRYGPILFGIAHIHHAYELVHVHRLDPMMVAVNTAFQTIYTSGFGILASHVHIKYHNVWCSIVMHSVCNLLGFPGDIKGTTGIKVIYYLLLLLGVYGFYHLTTSINYN